MKNCIKALSLLVVGAVIAAVGWQNIEVHPAITADKPMWATAVMYRPSSVMHSVILKGNELRRLLNDLHDTTKTPEIKMKGLASGMWTDIVVSYTNAAPQVFQINQNEPNWSITGEPVKPLSEKSIKDLSVLLRRKQ